MNLEVQACDGGVVLGLDTPTTYGLPTRVGVCTLRLDSPPGNRGKVLVRFRPVARFLQLAKGGDAQ